MHLLLNNSNTQSWSQTDVTPMCGLWHHPRSQSIEGHSLQQVFSLQVVMKLLLASWSDSQQVTLDTGHSRKGKVLGKSWRWMQTARTNWTWYISSWQPSLKMWVDRKQSWCPLSWARTCLLQDSGYPPKRCSGIFWRHCQQAKPVFSEESHVQSLGTCIPFYPSDTDS